MTKIYVSSDKPNNLEVSLNSYLSENKLSGDQKILIKPNIVEPAYKNACTSVLALKTVIGVLRENGISEIYIGDEPAIGIVEKSGFSMKKAYETIGYNSLDGKLINLQTLPTTQSIDGELQTRDIKDYLLINITLPKQHGQFNYSGVCKNLMGLVPAKQRVKLFHSTLSYEKEELTNIADEFGYDINKMNNSELIGLSYMKFSKENFPELYNKTINDEIEWIDFTNIIDQKINGQKIVSLTEKIMKEQPNAIHIIDGSYMLKKQEHFGEPFETNFAVVGGCPLGVDIVTIKKLGIRQDQVPYLQIIISKIQDKKIIINGNLGKIDLMPSEFLKDVTEKGWMFVKQ